MGKGSSDATIDLLDGTVTISAQDSGGNPCAFLSATDLLMLDVSGDNGTSSIDIDETTTRMATTNAGYITIVDDYSSSGKTSEITAEAYGQNNQNVTFKMGADRSSGYNRVQVDTGNGVYTNWKCNGSNVADINHYVKSSSGSTQIAQWDVSVRFLKNDNLMASYDGTTPVLASTGAYPNADTTIYLSSPISQQPHGIVLEFAPYVNRAPVGYGLATFFVPKARNTGASVCFVIAGASFDNPCCKWIYIHDDKLIGNNVNYQSGTSNGVKYNNAAYVLTKVYGV